MQNQYFILDIETCPNDLEKYFMLSEEKKQEMLNPIDSKIVAIGIRHKGQNKIFNYTNEKEILEEFWKEWAKMAKEETFVQLIGFNIMNFDMPFITARSFIHGVKIYPFNIKQLVDLRDKINAYRYGPTRGKLKEYASLLGLNVMNIDGGDIARLCKEKEFEKIKEYLINDLEITDKLLERAIETGIININRY